VVVTANKVERIAIVVINENPNQYDLEEDMYLSEWFRNKVRTQHQYAQNLYAAMCNNEFQKLEVMPILKDQTWSCSWRAAGGVVARIRNEGDYMNWYCSGIQDFSRDETDPRFNGGGYVPEGTITDEIREDLQKLGWVVVTTD
jgi:hypothetical protein